MTQTIKELMEDIERLELEKKKAILEQEIQDIQNPYKFQKPYIDSLRKPLKTKSYIEPYKPTGQNHYLCSGCHICRPRSITGNT